MKTKTKPSERIENLLNVMRSIRREDSNFNEATSTFLDIDDRFSAIIQFLDEKYNEENKKRVL